jgi:hypothetical protein
MGPTVWMKRVEQNAPQRALATVRAKASTKKDDDAAWYFGGFFSVCCVANYSHLDCHTPKSLHKNPTAQQRQRHHAATSLPTSGLPAARLIDINLTDRKLRGDY